MLRGWRGSLRSGSDPVHKPYTVLSKGEPRKGRKVRWRGRWRGDGVKVYVCVCVFRFGNICENSILKNEILGGCH